MWRSVLALPLAAGAILAAVGTVGVADPIVSIPASISFTGSSTDGGPLTFSDLINCRSGNGTSPGPPSSTTSWRCALEFSLASVPTDATVTSATLSLAAVGSGGVWVNPNCASPPGCPVDLGGYAGDGLVALGDLSAGSRISTFTPRTQSPTSEAHDVTAFVQGLKSTDSGWAGFTLSGGGTDDWLYWNVPGWAEPPALTISFRIPPASSSLLPSPSPTPTPSARPIPSGAVTVDLQPGVWIHSTRAYSWGSGADVDDYEVSSDPADCSGGVWLRDPIVVEGRCAMEFDLAALPADATLSSASLSIAFKDGDAADDETAWRQTAGRVVVLAGYAGDGTAQQTDLTDAPAIGRFARTSDSARATFDVTDFVTSIRHSDVHWAGLSLSAEPMARFVGPADAAAGPRLTITYGAPSWLAGPSRSPSITGSPGASPAVVTILPPTDRGPIPMAGTDEPPLAGLLLAAVSVTAMALTAGTRRRPRC